MKVINIPTKWRFLQNTTESMGMPKAAKTAGMIDELLKVLYPDNHYAEAWIEKCLEYEVYKGEISVRDVQNIAHSMSDCVACNVSESCDTCRFYKTGGHRLFKHFTKCVMDGK